MVLGKRPQEGMFRRHSGGLLVRCSGRVGARRVALHAGAARTHPLHGPQVNEGSIGAERRSPLSLSMRDQPPDSTAPSRSQTDTTWLSGQAAANSPAWFKRSSLAILRHAISSGLGCLFSGLAEIRPESCIACRRRHQASRRSRREPCKRPISPAEECRLYPARNELM